jgi:AbrB family looped-hinge helix DNA binding protein
MKKLDLQELANYSDKYVAFVGDIRHVIASGTSLADVQNILKEKKISDATITYIPPVDKSLTLSIPFFAWYTNLFLSLDKTYCYNRAVFRKVILSGKGHAMQDRKLVRIQEKGQVTIPTEIRKKLGLKRGDLVVVMETPEGVFITPQQVVATKAFDSIGNILKEQGVSLDELIASGCDIRTDL